MAPVITESFDPAFEQRRLNMLAMQFPKEAAVDMVFRFCADEGQDTFAEGHLRYPGDDSLTDSDEYRYFRTLLIALIDALIRYRGIHGIEPRKNGTVIARAGKLSITWGNADEQ